MLQQIKRYARWFTYAAIAGSILIAQPGCKANKCDCPTFDGHKRRH